MSGDNKLVHFTAGAISGTLGSIITCPLDVAKTRLQSSRVETYRRVDNPPNSSIYQKLNKINKTTQCNNNINNDSNNISNKNNSNSKIRNVQNLKRSFLSEGGTHKLRFMSTTTATELKSNESVGFIKCIRHIVHTEGYRALFKGLMPTLVGVAPARAIYFTTYEYCKKNFSNFLIPPSSTTSAYQQSIVHLLSAASAGITCTTATNPIWMIRTRLQLNNKSGVPLTTLQCIRNIYHQHGLRGFYKGLTASYFGVTETAIHFVIYEAIKARIIENRPKPPMKSSKSLATMSSISPTSSPSTSLSPLSSASSPQTSSSSSSSSPPTHTPRGACAVDGDEEDFFDVDRQVLSPEVPPLEFLKYMLAACTSKTIATFLAYPHEVARTRMREGNPKYTKFFGTLATVAREEGARALYRGLVTQLIKHIPNTAIVLTTYEAVVYICNRKGF